MCEQSLNDYITEQCALIDAALDRLLPAENESPETIHKAMRYSIFAGGKSCLLYTSPSPRDS